VTHSERCLAALQVFKNRFFGDLAGIIIGNVCQVRSKEDRRLLRVEPRHALWSTFSSIIIIIIIIILTPFCPPQGFSVAWWKNKHNTHHAVPNLVESSPDAHDGDPDIDTMPLLAWSLTMAKKAQDSESGRFFIR
jgi:hypothetical protein